MTKLMAYLTCVVLSGILCLSGQALAQADLSFHGDAASTRGFMLELAELYAAQRRVTINIEVTATEAAIDNVAAGEVDMAGSARPQRPERSIEQGVTFFPVAWDALVVVAHPNNPLRNLAVSQLRDIYAGTTTRWNQVGGDDAAIELYIVDSERDGVETVLRRMLGLQATVNADANTVGDTQSMESAIEANRHAVGVTTYSAARRLRVKILALEGRSASQDTIQSGAYLLYFPLYLVSRTDGPNRRQVRSFMEMTQSPNGRRQIRRGGAVPYMDGLALASHQIDRDQVLERALR